MSSYKCMVTSGCVAPVAAQNSQSPAAHGVGCAVAMAILARLLGFRLQDGLGFRVYRV